MILAYHSIADNPDDFWTISPSRFNEDMKYLKDNGYICISLRQFYENIYDEHFLVLTFDDGYIDLMDNVLPVLDKYGFTATLFIVVNCIGMKSVWREEKLQSPLITWNNIREINSTKHEIGSHGLWHKRLIDLNQNDLYNEIFESKAILESKTGKQLESFSYPFCLYDNRVINAVKNAGYKQAVAGGNGNAEKFSLHRIGIHKPDLIRNILA
ncbi:MAG: polysaccharide deacetylase family protein [Candidatus Marinimicrobia bacterium]|nr:polysaccharide deacetylase family protein [Candidatus Neomarinimicrobiota bacterium]